MVGPPPPDYELIRPRDEVDDFFVVKYPHTVIVVVAIYIWFVKVFGPKFMAKREPYKLTNIIRLYNIFQVLANGYIIAKVFIITPQMIQDYWTHYCHYFNTEDNPTFMQMAYLVRFILFTKLMDLADSVFIILKKNYRQLSFLHMYHHSSVLILSNYSLAYREGLTASVALLNSFIHVIMYSYYLLTSYKSIRPYLSSMKPLVTKMQIVQFVMMLLYCYSGWYQGCSISYVYGYIIFLNILSFLILFINFYIQNYLKNKKD